MRIDHRIPFRGALLASVAALAVFAACVQAQTYNFRVLHVFSTQDDGASPSSSVRFDAAGNLYGTTVNGGTHDAGVIFKIAADRTETILHSFDGAAGGDSPSSPVTIDPVTGDLYGTTYYGGSGCTIGCGVLYKLAADGTFTVLHSFDGANDGSGPGGPLLRDRQGNLYGTAGNGGFNGGGNEGNGTVFKYGADGSFTVLHAFTGTDSLNPAGGVIGDRAGNLYGVTLSHYTSGPDAPPSVYKLAPDGSLTTLHWFDYAGAGTPSGGLIGDEAGNLYGTTSNGGTNYVGTVFKLATDGSLTTLYTFTGGADGAYPNGELVRIGGNLYGTTFEEGYERCRIFPQGGCGTVFKLAADGTFTVLHAFRERDQGGFPSAGLSYQYGRLFGTTYLGCNGCYPAGSVYSVGVASP